MTYTQPGTNQFEFVMLSALRAAQLMRGCTPRVVAGTRPTVTAQREVAAGHVRSLPRDAAVAVAPERSPMLLEVVHRART